MRPSAQSLPGLPEPISSSPLPAFGPVVFGSAVAESGSAGDPAARDDSRPSSAASSPAPADIDVEESDFYNGANDSRSSLSAVPPPDAADLEDAVKAPVHRLPNEILMCVFRKLSSSADLFKCMLVCKRWARNCVEMLWHRPSFISMGNLGIICNVLNGEYPFFTYRDFVRRINLSGLPAVHDGNILPLAVCSRIERLTLPGCGDISDAGLVRLVEDSQVLHSIDITLAKQVTGTSINAIATHCKRLQGLNVTGCVNLSNESLINLARNCKFIKRVKLNDCVQIIDDTVMAFAENCANLLEIDLHGCKSVTNAPITALLTNSRALRELSLSNCELIDDDAFVRLASDKTYDHLRILDLTSCQLLTDLAVQKIISMAPRLRNLVLAKCKNITNASAYAISQLGKNLHYLHLGHCSNLTDDGLQKLVQECNRMRYIDLACCAHLTDQSVVQLAMLPKLKRIGLVKCFKITDESIKALASRKPKEHYSQSSHLERVHLSYCNSLTLASIYVLLNSCPGLTHLSLTGVPAFQNDDFVPYCRQAPADYTQHQRDMFCVFSGVSVARFRDFLNSSPRYDYLKETLPKHHRLHIPHPAARASVPRPPGTYPIHAGIVMNGSMQSQLLSILGPNAVVFRPGALGTSAPIAPNGPPGVTAQPHVFEYPNMPTSTQNARLQYWIHQWHGQGNASPSRTLTHRPGNAQEAHPGATAVDAHGTATDADTGTGIQAEGASTAGLVAQPETADDGMDVQEDVDEEFRGGAHL